MSVTDQPVFEYERPFLYPRQEWALFGPHRYGCCEASTKAGKTHGAIVWLIEQTLLHGRLGRKFWWIAPSRAQAKIAFTRIRNSAPPEYIQARESDLTIQWINGAIQEFKTAEDPNKLYGEDVYAAILDEASRARHDSFKAIRSTLTATRGPLRMIGNVVGKANWFYDLSRRYEREQARDPTVRYARITAQDAVDAGVLDQAEIDDAKKNLPPADYRELYEAIAQDDEDAFIPSEYVNAAIARTDIRPFGQLVIGADPSQGKGDSAAFAWRRGAVIERVEEFPGMDEFAFIGYILQLCRGAEPPTRINIDATGFGATVVKGIHRDYPALQKIVKGFHMAERSIYPDEYANIRAQCAGEFRKWLISTDDPVSLPDKPDGLSVELTCLRKTHNSAGRLLMESKDDLKARGYDSPNMADACFLTFAEPLEFVTAGEIKYPEQRKRRSLT